MQAGFSKHSIFHNEERPHEGLNYRHRVNILEISEIPKSGES